jgi:hypothetical protein
MARAGRRYSGLARPGRPGKSRAQPSFDHPTKKLRLVPFLAAPVLPGRAAEKIVVTVTHELDVARPAGGIAVPFSEIQRLPSPIKIAKVEAQ